MADNCMDAYEDGYNARKDEERSTLAVFRTESQVQSEMALVRTVCSIAHRQRAVANIPLTYPLSELQFNSNVYLFKDMLELIADETNVFTVTQNFGEGISVTSHGNLPEWTPVEIVHALDNANPVSVRLDIAKTPVLEEIYLARNAHRAQMVLRKAKGLTQKDS